MKMRNKKYKKADIGIQTLFFILMGIIMIWIIIFGINKIFFVSEQLSEQQRFEIKKELEQAFEYCSDPLNKGTFKTFEIESDQFNGFCLIDRDFLDSMENRNLAGQLEPFLATDENVILIKASFLKQAETYTLKEFQIIDSFNTDTDKTLCQFDYENTGAIILKVEC